MAFWPFSKFIWVSELIKKFGPDDVGMPHIKPLGKGLFEVRVKAKEGIGRALYCTIEGELVTILNGFVKKTQKTPAKELELAYTRMKEVKEYVQKN